MTRPCTWWLLAWYLTLNLGLDWKPVPRACAVRALNDFRISYAHWFSIRSVKVRTGIFQKIYEARLRIFSVLRIDEKGFPCYPWTGPPQCITARTVHHTVLVQYSGRGECPLRPPKVWSHQSLESGDCPVNITIWQLGQQLRSAELVSFLRLGNTWQHGFILSATGL